MSNQHKITLQFAGGFSIEASLFQDGDMWCVLLGEDIQKGISGFGRYPDAAAYVFKENFLSTRAGEAAR